MRNCPPLRTVVPGAGRRAGLLLCAALLLTGCARTLTIWQDPYINTACHAARPPQDRTGQPLELAIVCVYPKDLEKPANALLKPDSKITCRDWYARRPLGPNPEAGRFELNKNQIFLLTDDSKAYGTVVGSKLLRGARQDGEKPIRLSFWFEGGWTGAQYHHPNSVIYVFGKFTDKDGNVLPVPPAKFHPPGAYREDLEIRIGVDPDRPLEAGQYIKVLTERKLHGKEES